jgi:biotin carboxyl carrier protein
MSDYKVQVNGATHTVAVEPTSKNALKIEVDGIVFETESMSDEEVWTWIVGSDAKPIRAHARPLAIDRFDVWVGGVPFLALVQPSLSGVSSTARARISQEGLGGEIRALMPGRVTSILVKPGEAVEVGTPLLILEAMKMQNEITSPIAGSVAAVHVTEGATVKRESLLIVLK